MGNAFNTFLAISTGGVSIPITKAIDDSNRKKANAAAAPLPMPQAPNAAAVADTANNTIQRRKAAMTQSIYTSPLGIDGQAQVARKTLTGQ